MCIRDSVEGGLLVLPLGVEGEVDHHDRILLDDADEKNDADERDDREVLPAENEREESPDARGRKRRKDRDGVDRALVQDAEKDVDRHERGENEERRVRERRTERPRGSLESRLDALGKAELLSRLFDGSDSPSERGVRSEVERHGRDGELPLMVHGERRVRRLDGRERAQRHRAAGRRAQVDVLEVFRTDLQLGLPFENDAVLVELSEHRRDLALPERVVERVVDLLRCDAEPRRRVPVDDDARLKSRVLHVARDVAQLGQAFQLLDESRDPRVQLGGVGVLEAVLVLRPADPILHREVLHGLKEERHSGDLLQLRLEPADQVVRANLALVERLEVDLDSPAVRRLVRAVDADERREALDGGVLQDDGRELLLPLRHRLEGGGLRRLRDAEEDAGVLNREEALRDHDVQEDRRDERGDRDDERRRLVPEDPVQRAVVEVDDPIEGALGSPVEAALLRRGSVVQEARAHHRRERERDDRGDEDRHRQRHRELAEQPPHDVAHEEERNEDGDEGHGQRQDREPDLLGPLQRGRERLLPRLDVPRDVLDHDDRVVHHEAGRDRQRHEREVVQAVTECVHRGERAHEGERNRDARDDRGRDAPQEQEDDHDDESDHEHQLELDVLDRRADRRGAVRQDREVDRGRQAALELREERLDAVDDRDYVRARLPLDVQDHGRRLVHPGCLLHVFGTVDDRRHVGEMNGRAVLVGDDERAVVGALEELVVRADRVRLRGPVEAPLRLVDVRLRESRPNVLHREAVGGQSRGVHLNTDRRLLAAADRHEAYSRKLRDLLGEARVGDVLHLRERQRLRREGERENRGVGRVRLAVDRRVRQVDGEKRPRGVDRGLYLLLGDVDVELERELER